MRKFIFLLGICALLVSMGCSKNSGKDRRSLMALLALGPGSAAEYPDGVTIDQRGRLTITQYGITWLIRRDDGNYSYGTFANGDYWVVGPVNVIGVDPPSNNVLGRIKNGSMLNPSPVEDESSPYRYSQGFDNAITYSPYYASFNAARPNGNDLSESNPLRIETGSLLSAISVDAVQGNQLQTAAVLTVISAEEYDANRAALLEGTAFRPPYSGTDKSILHTKNDLNYGLLRRLPEPAAVYAPYYTEGDLTLERVSADFERVWVDFLPANNNGTIAPLDNMPVYGMEMSNITGRAALFLHMDYTVEEKDRLLVGLVQRGIDLYGTMRNGGRMNWYDNGGSASGRKFPIIFAGLMLGDAGMQNIGQRSGDYINHYDPDTGTQYGPGNAPPDYIYFGEDDQTFYVTQDDIDWTTGEQWEPDRRNVDPDTGICECAPYTAGDLGVPEWAEAHALHPTHSDQHWRAEYRSVAGASWAGWILAIRIMDARSLWNHDALFDYMDRYMAITKITTIGPDPAWHTAVNEHISAAWSTRIQGWWGLYPDGVDNMPGRQSSDHVQNMWDEYRDDF